MNAEVKKALQQVPVIANERYERIWNAIVERTISENQKKRVRVSALIDGELPEDERAGAAQFLAGDPQLARDTAIWKKLAAATAALPVPQISEAAARKTALRISQRTQAARKVSETVDDAALTPQISHERWQKVWQGIEGRVQKKAVAPAPQVIRKVTPMQRWRWVFAATAAAAVIALTALLNFNGPAVQPETVAAVTKLPNALDDRYESSLEFVNGNSVVCFYLKPLTSSGDSNSDSRWLPD